MQTSIVAVPENVLITFSVYPSMLQEKYVSTLPLPHNLMALPLPQSHVVKPVIPELHVTVTIEIPIVPTMFSSGLDINLVPVLLTRGLFRPPRCLILGGIIKPVIPRNDAIVDYNAAVESGIYNVTVESPANKPSGIGRWVVLIVFKSSYSYILQIAVEIGGNLNAYARSGNPSQDTWGNWGQLNN